MVINTTTVKLLRISDIRSNNNSDIASMFTIKEIKSMQEVSDEEKKSCEKCLKRGCKGFIDYAHTKHKIFIDLYDGDYEEV